MLFTVIVDVDTQKDTPTRSEVRDEIERRLLTTKRPWRFTVWRAEDQERSR